MKTGLIFNDVLIGLLVGVEKDHLMHLDLDDREIFT
jgi:hypothetical protein